MGNPLGYQADKSFEKEAFSLSAFFALDGSSNVIGFSPTASPPTLVGPYSRARGMQKALGPAGGVISQPHTATGTYVFLTDEPWQAATETWLQLLDQGAVAVVNYFIDVNVSANQLGGANPGCNPAIAAQTVRVRFRNNAGALTDPVANTGFYLGMKLLRGLVT